ncbi:MAG: hypothetical protein AB7M05_01720 [Alphaproteobacteria bacterium]
MPVRNHSKIELENFFQALAPVEAAYRHACFSYLAVQTNERFVLVQARLFLASQPHQIPATHFQSPNVRAGNYKISELGITSEELVNKILTGDLTLPSGKIEFPPKPQDGYSIFYEPFHPEGLKNQNRLNALTITGLDQTSLIRRPHIDWELKAATTPYDTIEDLINEYQLGLPRNNAITFEIVGFTVAAINIDSSVEDTKAKIIMRLARGLEKNYSSIGYRIFSQGRVVARATIDGENLEWTDAEHYYSGQTEVEVPRGALLQCYARYKGIAENYWWMFERGLTQNPYRNAYEKFDSDLETLKDIIAKAQGRGQDARDLESAVAWLLWMLGFSVSHLGSTRRTQEAVDILATTPSGHFAVVECTTGHLKAENKLSLLYDRAQSVKRSLEASNNNHIRVLPVIITSKARSEILVDLEQAEKIGILVLTREDLEESIKKTILPPHADRLYEQAEQHILSAATKYAPQGSGLT